MAGSNIYASPLAEYENVRNRLSPPKIPDSLIITTDDLTAYDVAFAGIRAAIDQALTNAGTSSQEIIDVRFAISDVFAPFRDGQPILNKLQFNGEILEFPQKRKPNRETKSNGSLTITKRADTSFGCVLTNPTLRQYAEFLTYFNDYTTEMWESFCKLRIAHPSFPKLQSAQTSYRGLALLIQYVANLDLEDYRTHNIKTSFLYYLGLLATPFRVQYNGDESVMLTVPKTVEAIMQKNDVREVMHSFATHGTDVPDSSGRNEAVTRERVSNFIAWGLHLFEATEMFGCIPILFCFHALEAWSGRMARNTNLENAMKDLRQAENERALNKFKQANFRANGPLLESMNKFFQKIGLPILDSIDIGGYERPEYSPVNGK